MVTKIINGKKAITLSIGLRIISGWAYAALEKSKVRGASGPHILTDLVSLVRFALDQENELVPFPEKVDANFNAWLAQQGKSSQKNRFAGLK